MKYGDILLCDGPALNEGFFYEFFMGDRAVSSDDFTELEDIMSKITKQVLPALAHNDEKKLQFERMVVTKEVARKMFDYNKFKQEILSIIPDGETITLYKCGDFIDLCRY
jgi:threonyl-tRNA synthetase